MKLWGLCALVLLASCLTEADAQPIPRRVGPGSLSGRGSGVSYGIVRRVDAGAPGTLPREVIREVVRSRMTEVDGCYRAGLAHDRNLAGRVSIAFTLDARGAVTEALVAEDGLDRPQVAQCIAERAARWSFPPPGGVMRFRYPFHLRSE
ncbi:MAG: AgmX/PglI C-terminal domain-containing protein [Polyangiales bacterium]